MRFACRICESVAQRIASKALVSRFQAPQISSILPSDFPLRLLFSIREMAMNNGLRSCASKLLNASPSIVPKSGLPFLSLLNYYLPFVYSFCFHLVMFKLICLINLFFMLETLKPVDIDMVDWRFELRLQYLDAFNGWPWISGILFILYALISLNIIFLYRKWQKQVLFCIYLAICNMQR